MRLKTVAVFYSIPEALVASSLLTACSIHNTLEDFHIISQIFYYDTALGGIKLKVEEGRVELAEEILNSRSEPNEELCPSSSEAIDVCRDCLSQEVHKLVNLLFTFIIFAITFVPTPIRSNKRECKVCGHKWTKI